MKKSRLVLLALIAALIAAFFIFDLKSLLSLEAIKAHRATLESWRSAQPLLTAAAFFGVYVLVTSLSVPGATFLTIAAGAIFGLLWGAILVSFASTLGATVAFLSSRYLFRDALQKKYGARLKTMNAGIAKDGAFYLFTLRVVPLFPFFVINLMMGLTPLRTWTYYWATQLGTLPATLIYVNAGTQLAQLESPSDILSLELLGAFVLLGLFPLIAKKIIDRVRAARSPKK